MQQVICRFFMLFVIIVMFYGCDNKFTLKFGIEKVEAEVGEIFAIPVTAIDEVDQKVSGFNVSIGLTIKHNGSEEDVITNGRIGYNTHLNRWDTDKYHCGNVHSPDTTKYHFCVNTLDGELIATLHIDSKSYASASIPIAITSNTKIKGDFSLDVKKQTVSVQLTDARANTKYDAEIFSELFNKKNKREFSTHADGKGMVSFVLPERVGEKCEIGFAAKVSPQSGADDDSRAFVKRFDLPCISEDGTITVDSSGLVSVSDYHVACYNSEHTKTTINWFYAEHDEYPSGKISGELELGELGSKVDLGNISNFDPNSCYYVVVHMGATCTVSSGGAGSHGGASSHIKKKIGDGCSS